MSLIVYDKLWGLMDEDGHQLNRDRSDMTSAVLDLLLQYMYRQPQPDLKKVDFETLAGVSEAAEKYQVFAAISWCKLLME